MQDNRNDDSDQTPRRANTPPPVGSVRGLGYVDVLRIELPPGQLQWLVDGIDTLSGCADEHLAHVSARAFSAAAKRSGSRDIRETEEELERVAYKREVLQMIRRQLPVGPEPVHAGASPWEEPSVDVAPEPRPGEEPLVVVGPAAVMTELVAAAAIDAAETLASALGGPIPGVDRPGTRERPRPAWVDPDVTPTMIAKLRAIAAAAQTYSDLWGDLVLQQGYKFEPDREPLRFDELE